MTGGVPALRAIAIAQSRSLKNTVIRGRPGEHATRAVLLVAISVYLVQMTSVATDMFRAGPMSAPLADAAFAGMWVFAVVRAVSRSLAWVGGDADLRLLGALPVPSSEVFLVHHAAVVWDVARMQLLSAPFLVGYAVAAAPSVWRTGIFVAGWTLVMLAAAAAGTLGGVVAARWTHPARAQTAFRVLALASIVAFFAIAMRVADVGGAAIPWLTDLDAFVGWLPTSWVRELLLESPLTRLTALTALAAASTWAAAAAFARWFDLDAAVTGAYSSPRLVRDAARGRRTRRSVFTAVIIKDARSALRSTTTLARWVAPVVLALVFARVSGGRHGQGLGAAITVNVTAMVAALVVGHALAGDEVDEGWVIRVNARAPRAVTAAKVALVAMIAGGAAAGALLLHAGPGALLAGAGHITVLAVGHAAFSIGIERLRRKRAPRVKHHAPGLIGVLARQLYMFITVACMMAPLGTGTTTVLLMAPLAVAIGVVVVAERRAVGDRRLW